MSEYLDKKRDEFRAFFRECIDAMAPRHGERAALVEVLVQRINRAVVANDAKRENRERGMHLITEKGFERVLIAGESARRAGRVPKAPGIPAFWWSILKTTGNPQTGQQLSGATQGLGDKLIAECRGAIGCPPGRPRYAEALGKLEALSACVTFDDKEGAHRLIGELTKMFIARGRIESGSKRQWNDEW